MDHPIENDLYNSTSQSETDILAKSRDERSHNNNTASAALRHPIQLSSSNLSHENLLVLPLGPASASLAQRQPIWPSVNLSGLCVSLWSLCVTHAGSLWHCAAPGCLCMASGCFCVASSWLCVNPLRSSALMLQVPSLPLCFCIHCPSASTLFTPSISSASPAPEYRILDEFGVFSK